MRRRFFLLGVLGASGAEVAERLRAVEAFLASGGAGRCDVPQVDSRRLTSWASFSRAYRGRPVVVRRGGGGGGGDGAPEEAQRAATREGFLALFGERRVKTNNGHFDHLRTKEVVTVREYVSQAASADNMFLADRAYNLQAEVVAALGPVAAPDFLEGFDARPILSLGVRASATMFHRHDETWQVLLAGRKAWWLTPGETLPEGSGGDPCVALARVAAGEALPPEARLCVQQQGEVMYFGDQLNHATCNLDEFVLGVGAQGRADAWPPLQRAARNGDAAAVRRLLEEVGDADARDARGNTALHRAVAGGHLAVVALLVGAGADVNLRDESSKHAMLASAERGDLELVRFLVEAGTPVRRKDKGSAQAVHWASLSGHAPVLSYLLSQRADVRARDSRGTEPLHWAALESDVATVEFLRAQGGDPHVASNDGTYPLHWAAGVGHASIVSLLLRLRASPSLQDARGTSPLFFAAAQDRVAVIAALLAGRADVNARLASQGNSQAVHLAAGMGNPAALRALLAARASPDAVDGRGRRPVHAAMDGGGGGAEAKGGGHLAVLEILAAHRADFAARDAAGVTAAFLAAARGHARARDFLLSHGTQGDRGGGQGQQDDWRGGERGEL